MLQKLESLKKDINKMIGSDYYDKNELIKKSQELDKYIVEFIKEKLLDSNETLEKKK